MRRISLLGFAHQRREPPRLPIMPYPLRLESQAWNALLLPVLPFAHFQETRWLEPRRDFCHFDCVARDILRCPPCPSRHCCGVGVVRRNCIIEVDAQAVRAAPKLAKRTKFLVWPVERACQFRFPPARFVVKEFPPMIDRREFFELFVARALRKARGFSARQERDEVVVGQVI